MTRPIPNGLQPNVTAGRSVPHGAAHRLRCARRGSLGLVLAALLATGCSTTVPAGADDAEADANAAIAAGVPVTDIWLLPLRAVLTGDVRAETARNVTTRRGYDNQPAFSLDGKQVYYSSIRDNRQSDVFLYDIDQRRTRQLTATPQSEYSPTPRPGGGFTAIQVALDGTQRLWFYSEGAPSHAIRPDIIGVGYHAWLSDDHLALFLVEEPPRLVFAAADGDLVQTVARNVGRSLHRRADGTLGYVSKADESRWHVHVVDAAGRQDRRLVETRPEREDLAWLPDGAALSGEGTTLWRLPPGGPSWRRLVDLEGILSGEISRLAVDPAGEWLAVVVVEKKNQ